MSDPHQALVAAGETPVRYIFVDGAILLTGGVSTRPTRVQYFRALERVDALETQRAEAAAARFAAPPPEWYDEVITSLLVAIAAAEQVMPRA